MKQIILILSILVLSISAAIADGTVTLIWDASNPAPDGYRLYQRSEGQPYDYDSPVWSGTDNAGIVKGLIPGNKYYFVARARYGDNESGNSNEIEYLAVEGRTCLNITDDGGQQVADIQPGTYLLEGFDYVVEIRPPPAATVDPPYSINRSRTIYHLPGCRYYNADRGLSSPVACEATNCRPCMRCGTH